ncbi:1-hydroxycarotenoid 3,4-desaturase CrtD [Roseospira visakhapatnamensis]|uniref:1-hydroxycarotenoid 3,4-desaturase n=1 Tax=Roseospira visakhapatnamensis TaxID=390880 RepID=A0A7W6WBU3_9PROT|nr:1-hydroxycarotenoid 3,4-desaturase CrtD [Roseospira visakhapatnamensis]MBB4267891.1 1-hydroxycarotenoid 3,4-desaturase [Roseospira visakhapatnamensis]
MPASPTAERRVVIVGAGMGGLSAAIDLAARGVAVDVIEAQAAPGGKMRQVAAGDTWVDAGPTVFTMRWVIDDLLAAAGTRIEDHVTLHPLSVLARHAWDYGDRDQRLDLFTDPRRTEDAIGAFAGAAEARRFRTFRAEAARIYDLLDHTFIRASRPSMPELVRRGGLRMAGVQPFTTLWSLLGKSFQDPRLRQLFGRYATYCGSSPFLATATLMLVVHVELNGVWGVDGGLHALARALAGVAESRGVTLRYGQRVTDIAVTGGRASAVTLDTGERLEADAIIVNADVNALASGAFGPAVAQAVPGVPVKARSLSALTWTMTARPDGVPLSHHTVVFGPDYPGEFRAIFDRHRLPEAPTVYICAQDRLDETTPGATPRDAERLLVLVNAPPVGESRTPALDPAEIDACQDRTFALLDRCGLRIRPDPDSVTATGPREFNRLFPATGGALYGRASHGWQASFTRPGARTRIPGLYLAGGSVHPGPGVPMAALSGRQAASSVMTDLTSTSRFHRVATPGGTSTG